jgi:PelA/Pel-15E family pectate lyase
MPRAPHLSRCLLALTVWGVSSACGGAEEAPQGTVAGTAGVSANAGAAGGGSSAGSSAGGGRPGDGSAGSGAVGGSGGSSGSAGGSPPPFTGGSPGAVAGAGSAEGGVASAGSEGGAAGTGGAPAAGGDATAGAATAGAGGAPSGATTLDQMGNPVYGLLDGYKAWLSAASGDAAKLSADRTFADRLLTWQLPQGGFYKNDVSVYAAAWNGSAARSGWTGAGGVELGTIDNGATITELMFLADVYRRASDTKYRDAARKALDFLLNMQYPTGGFPQVYPERPGSYSNAVTFNDDAMVRVMILLLQASRNVPPLGMDLFTAEQRGKLATAFDKGISYILAAQIVQGGVKTVWCAQHDPKTYAPVGARSYELASKSGNESVGVVTLLLTQPQTAAIKASAQAAIAWYKRSGVANTAYVKRPSGSTDDSHNPIQAMAGSTLWYRFYDLAEDVGFFSGRLPTDDPPGSGKQYDIMKIEPERRYGYQWGGAYGTRLFAYTDKLGY